MIDFSLILAQQKRACQENKVTPLHLGASGVYLDFYIKQDLRAVDKHNSETKRCLFFGCM